MATLTPTLRAAIWMIGAIISFSSMAVAGRELGKELDTFEIMLFRSIVGIIVVLSIGGITGHLREINRRNFDLHLLRNIAHFTGQNLWFFALTMIPLAQVFALEFTSPLWVVALAPILLGERFTKIKAVVAVLGFIGILIVTRPGMENLSIGVLAAAISAVTFAFTAIFTRKLTRSQSLTNILFYLVSIQIVFGLICAGYDGDIAIPSPAAWPYLILVGLAGLLAHFCLTKALSIAPASTVMPLDFVRLPLIAVVGMLFYNEPLDAFVFIGAAVIFAANYLNIRNP